TGTWSGGIWWRMYLQNKLSLRCLDEPVVAASAMYDDECDEPLRSIQRSISVGGMDSL
ncbi:hypothetical protein A2U01_0010765, partial [Trifolium medium]|nr:hypothetical protein [Trifolium medium]